MIYYLIFFLLLLLIASLGISKDFLFPSNIVILSFLFSAVLATFNLKIWNFEIMPKTVFYILTFVITFFVGSLIGKIMVPRSAKRSGDITVPSIGISIPSWKLITIILFQLIVLLLVARSTKSLLGIINTDSIRTYRMESAYGDGMGGSIPWWILQLTKVSRMTSLVSIYVLIYNKIEKKIKKTNWRLLVVSVCLYIPLPLFGGARFDLIVLILYALMVLLILRIKKRDYSDVGSIIWMTVFVFLGIMVFSITRTIVGRTSDKGIIAYLSEYFGGSTVLLDAFLKNPLHANYFGEETLMGINKLLNTLRITNNPTSAFFEFRSVNGYPIGNVYTSIRSFVYDFGFIGIPIFGFIQGILFSFYYKVIRIKKVNGISISIIFYSFIAYSLFFSAFQEMFFSLMLSTNFLTFLILLFVIKRFYISRKGDEAIDENV